MPWQKEMKLFVWLHRAVTCNVARTLTHTSMIDMYCPNFSIVRCFSFQDKVGFLSFIEAHVFIFSLFVMVSVYSSSFLYSNTVSPSSVCSPALFLVSVHSVSAVVISGGHVHV